MATVLEQVMKMSVDEKLQLISAIWESMTKDPDKTPVPNWQLQELERRIESQRQDPQPGQTWDEVKREIRHGKT
jgi:putative addiction module component (TIGR02574 family)